ncbi:M23 family metallopeptidase [Arthrobacter sp. GMC3]|uniref:M23 family metallopeptidase n=1 Tax=Arthrobacter sp. GMC3 TaxID=2058894 RepID=UPI002157EE27|nr:peptidoglycan DD-metalloendopeptidase family protein [Arthrobacter sp. GMC3]
MSTVQRQSRWRFLAGIALAVCVLPMPGPTDSMAAGSLSSVVSDTASDTSSGTTAVRPLPASLAWAWPVAGPSPGGPPRVVRAFDPPAKPWLSGHRGVDLLAPFGATIRAPAAGVITFAGTVVDRPVLTIATPDGLRLSFEPVTSTLAAGATVTKGQELGSLATPTHCDAGPPGQESCLHWGVRRGEDYLNPLQFVLDLRPSVLLPLSG